MCSSLYVRSHICSVTKEAIFGVRFKEPENRSKQLIAGSKTKRKDVLTVGKSTCWVIVGFWVDLTALGDPSEPVGLFLFLFFFKLRCTACGILVPQPGIEPWPLAMRVMSPNHWTAREFPNLSVWLQRGVEYKCRQHFTAALYWYWPLARFCSLRSRSSEKESHLGPTRLHWIDLVVPYTQHTHTHTHTHTQA